MMWGDIRDHHLGRGDCQGGPMCISLKFTLYCTLLHFIALYKHLPPKTLIPRPKPTPKWMKTHQVLWWKGSVSGGSKKRKKTV